MIYISMNVIEARASNLKRTIPVLSPQCDKLYINLVGFDEVPDLPYDNIEYTLFGKVGSEHKFYHYNSIEDGDYYFTVDDDIFYPNNYTEYMISKIDAYNKQPICCVHGSRYNLNVEKDFHHNRNRLTYHFAKQLSVDKQVMIPGTGTTCIVGGLLNFSMKDFEHKNMDDQYIGTFAYKQNIPILSIARDHNWLQPLDGGGISIYGNNPHTEIDKLINTHFK